MSQGVKQGNLEIKLAVNKYAIDKDVHITIQEDICRSCGHHRCVQCCPAGCYKLSEKGVSYSYEGCLECGSCRIVCDRGSVKWDIPRGGLGVCFEYG